MCPNGEGPTFVADEVGVIVRDAEVVNLCELFGRADRHDGNKFAGKGRQFITGRQFARRCPALAQHVERMLGRRPDYMARDVELQDHRRAGEKFLDPLEDDRAVRVVLVAGGDPIVGRDVLDELEALVGENFRSRRTP